MRLERNVQAALDGMAHRGKWWRVLCEAQAKLLVSYRMGSRPSGKTLDDITKARAKLIELGVEDLKV